MAIKLSTSDFCESCLKVRCGNNGGAGTVKELLLSPGYQDPRGYSILNNTIQYALEDNGGCSNCLNKVRQAT
jgi:hypothetical protein